MLCICPVGCSCLSIMPTTWLLFESFPVFFSTSLSCQDNFESLCSLAWCSLWFWKAVIASSSLLWIPPKSYLIYSSILKTSYYLPYDFPASSALILACFHLVGLDKQTWFSCLMKMSREMVTKALQKSMCVTCSCNQYNWIWHLHKYEIYFLKYMFQVLIGYNFFPI